MDFCGRARRSEFWHFVLFWTAACGTTGQVLSAQNAAALAAGHYAVLLQPHNLVILVPLVLLLPFAAVAVRRLHDVGVSGWWLLSATVPVPVLDVFIVGAQVFCFARPGTVGDNQYGPDPRRTDMKATAFG